ncbi:MAG: TIGR03089 family protein [Egibacteraceae bacterium]
MKIPAVIRLGATQRPDARNWSELAARRLAEEGSQPWLTYLDDATGERTELSHATFDNWVAKTANMLVEDAEVDHGNPVLVALDGHWALPIVLHACARVGAVAVSWSTGEARPAISGVAVVHEVVADQFDPGEHVYIVGDGMGGRPQSERDWPAFTEDVLAYADDYDDPDVEPDLELVSSRAGERELVFDQAGALAIGAALLDLGVRPGDRMLLAGPADRVDLLLVGLGAYVAGAAVALGRRLSPEAIWRHADQERAAWIVTAPEALAELVATADVSADLRGVLCTGPLSIGEWRAARERLRVAVCPSLGRPDAGLLSAVVPVETVDATLDWLADQPGHLAGTAVSGARLTILQASTQPVEQHGETGELGVGGPLVASAIGPPPALTEDALRTGEQGSLQIGPDGREWLLLH